MIPEKPWDYAHSYADELPEAREPIEPIITTWTEAAWIIIQAGIILVLIVGILLTLFLWAGAVVEAP